MPSDRQSSSIGRTFAWTSSGADRQMIVVPEEDGLELARREGAQHRGDVRSGHADVADNSVGAQLPQSGESAMRSDDGVPDFEPDLVDLDNGDSIETQTLATRLDAPDSRVEGIVVVLRNVTELRRGDALRPAGVLAQGQPDPPLARTAAVEWRGVDVADTTVERRAHDGGGIVVSQLLVEPRDTGGSETEHGDTQASLAKRAKLQ